MDKDMSLYQKKIKENISILINENKLREAKEVLSQYESIVSNDTDVYSTKAVIYMMEGNIEQAEQVLVEGLNASKGNFDLLYNLAYLYQSKGQTELAIEYYKEAFLNAKAEEDRDSVYGILQELGIQETKQELLKNKVPKTSIIILTYNNLEYNKLCIESIREYTQKGTYEIIIVDNHSTDGTVEWLKEQKDLRLILNDENQGFPKGCNQGIEMAEEGNDILLLNNDT
ncbi:MAG: hypothetical protein K0R84_1561, partial [Clostridia bacterium]|nr:hypothetical protein [Clostridia bacterium]